LVSGAMGDFEISVAGRTLFSKRTSHRFPSDDEVLALLDEGI